MGSFQSQTQPTQLLSEQEKDEQDLEKYLNSPSPMLMSKPISPKSNRTCSIVNLIPTLCPGNR
jgi:hypothetical protein